MARRPVDQRNASGRNDCLPRLILVLFGAALAAWGALFIHKRIEAYPTVDRYGRPAIAFPGTRIGLGILLILIGVLPWGRIFRARKEGRH